MPNRRAQPPPRSRPAGPGRGDQQTVRLLARVLLPGHLYQAQSLQPQYSPVDRRLRNVPNPAQSPVTGKQSGKGEPIRRLLIGDAQHQPFRQRQRPVTGIVHDHTLEPKIDAAEASVTISKDCLCAPTARSWPYLRYSPYCIWRYKPDMPTFRAKEAASFLESARKCWEATDGQGSQHGYGSERGSHVPLDTRAHSGPAPDATAPRRGHGGGRAHRTRRLPDRGRRLRLGSGARPAVNDQPAGRGHARSRSARRGGGPKGPAGTGAAGLAVRPHVP